jgi:hypothetical protein
MYAWGAGTLGQLGTGQWQDMHTPAAVQIAAPAWAVCGANHVVSCTGNVPCFELSRVSSLFRAFRVNLAAGPCVQVEAFWLGGKHHWRWTVLEAMTCPAVAAAAAAAGCTWTTMKSRHRSSSSSSSSILSCAMQQAAPALWPLQAAAAPPQSLPCRQAPESPQQQQGGTTRCFLQVSWALRNGAFKEGLSARAKPPRLPW